MKDYVTKNQLIIFSVLWLLLAPLAYSFLSDIDALRGLIEPIFYFLLALVLIIGAVLAAYSYYLRPMSSSLALRILVAVFVAGAYFGIGYYYFLLVRVLSALIG